MIQVQGAIVTLIMFAASDNGVASIFMCHFV